MTTNNEDDIRIRAAIGALLDDAPDAPSQRPTPSSALASGPSRWLLTAAAAAIAVLGVAGLVIVATRDTPNTPAPTATAPPSVATTVPVTGASTVPVTDPPTATNEFRTQTEDFLDDASIVADDVGGDVSGATCDEPASTVEGTTYRCVAQVEGLGEYEFDVRILEADAFEVEGYRAT